MRNGTTLAIEPIADKIETEFWPLLEKHRLELATDLERMVLAPRVDQYRALEEAGVLFAIVARDNGAPIGYSVNFLGQHLHYGGLRYAQNDVLYLKPEYRTGQIGRMLIDATECEAKSLGCSMLIWHAKQATALEKILPRLGYGVQDIMFSKAL
ncbi:MAG: GNAT family N-acetyltransferase [Leptothrix ochracea]|uniref:GNAT family N-acetyltransferase n=1 Tax=Leptothrix ochracea TaxID=735331 RepID=UPI0034E25378